MNPTPTMEESQERQRAMRLVLARPFMSAGTGVEDEIALVRKHAAHLRAWLSEQAGWTLDVEPALVRLRKTPPTTDDDTRAATDNQGRPFTRRRYVLTCLALAVLSRAERQTTLGKIVEGLEGLVANDEGLREAGVTLTMQTQDERRDVVAVLRFLLEHGVLERLDGDEDEYVRNSEKDALYNINRPQLSAMLVVSRPPSQAEASTLDGRIASVRAVPLVVSEATRNRDMRRRLVQRLLDDPVVLYDALPPEERDYLRGQRGSLCKLVTAATGLEPEVRAEGIAMVGESDDITDVKMPEEGTEGHLTLLLATFLAGRARQSPGQAVARAVIEAHVHGLVDEHRAHWSKAATAAGRVPILVEDALGRLVALRLARRHGDDIVPLPTMGRYGCTDPTIIGGVRKQEGVLV